MPVTIPAVENRHSETPVGVMTTLASPTLGPSAVLSLWRVEMEAGVTGPLHVFDSEQLWTVLAGELTITVDGAPAELAAGDTIVIPTGLERQVHSRTAVRLIVCGAGDAVASVPGEEAPRGTPAWIA
ncbi:MAG TPA: cupin domain-containing protein [Acidimicrobiales bacterium]